MDKLQELTDIEGFDDPQDMLAEYIIDSMCPAICTNPGCDYTLSLEHDNDSGFCEVCGTYTVKSAMMLAGII